MKTYRRLPICLGVLCSPWRFLPLIASILLLFTSSPLQGEGATPITVNTASQLLRGNPAARLLSDEFSSEHWEFTARFDSGHLLFVHFLITNIGWGDRNAVVVGHVVTPEGEVHQFGNARRQKNWRLSEDRLHFEIGSNVLDLHGPQYRLQVDKKKTRLDLRFQADTPAVWSKALTQSGYALDLLATAVPVNGTLWIAGMAEPIAVHGILAATHSWMQEPASSVLVRRVEFFTLRDDLPLYGIDLTTPTGNRSRWLVMKQPGKQPFAADTFELTFGQEQESWQDSRYTVPEEIRLKSAWLDGQLNLDRILLRHDPFAYLPGPLRFLASTILNLHPLQVWAASPFALLMQPTPIPTSFSSTTSSGLTTQQGTGIIAITFLNPLPAGP